MAVQGANGDMIDLESSLLQQFSCLATQDKDVLINEFQRLLSPNLISPERCAFFLDMNNWNLQQAICSYFDLDAPKELGLEALPVMSFIKDVTIGEGEEVPPETRFVKTWRIQNPGPEKWPPGCSLRFINGHLMGNCERVIVDPLEPGQMADVSLEMISPSHPGIYQGQWKMSTATGQFFGEIIWVIITVAEGGLLSLTQQMDSFHQLGSPVKSNSNQMVPNVNPFGPRVTRMQHEDEGNYTPEEFFDDYSGFPTSSCVNWVQSECAQETNTSMRDVACEQSQSQPNSQLHHHHQLQQLQQPQQQQSNNESVINRNQRRLAQHEAKNISLSESNHLPPTPPPSEDMML